MQNTSQEPDTTTHYSQPQPVTRSYGSFVLHLPEAKTAVLPFTPKVIVRLVLAWLAVLIVANSIAMNFVGQPQLSQVTPARSGQMRAQISADEERQANINSLQIYLQKYYEQFAMYPSVSQINSIEFRKADPAFKVANRHTFMDPLGNTAMLATQPTKNTYFYTPTPLGCDSSKVQCSGYTIGAILGNGQLYTKHNTE